MTKYPTSKPIGPSMFMVAVAGETVRSISATEDSVMLWLADGTCFEIRAKRCEVEHRLEFFERGEAEIDEEQAR